MKNTFSIHIAGMPVVDTRLSVVRSHGEAATVASFHASPDDVVTVKGRGGRVYRYRILSPGMAKREELPPAVYVSAFR